MRYEHSSVYRSKKSREIMQRIYREQLSAITVPYEELYVSTRYGRTHVVKYGNRNGIPVLVFHGGNASNPAFASYALPNLDTEHLQIIIPDTIGEIGFSAERRFRGDELEYGLWARDVLSALNLKQVICFGVSQGAGMAVRLSTVAPEKIKKLILMIPSGIANAPIMNTLTKMAPPFLRFLLLPTKANMAKIMSPFIDERNDEFTEYMKLSFIHTHFQFHMPRDAKLGELDRLKAPVYVLGGELDVIFPGKAVLRKAKKLFPNIKKTVLMRNYKHGDMLRTTDEYTKYFKDISRICLKEED